MSAATERLAQAIADVIAEAVGAVTPIGVSAIPPADLTVAEVAARMHRDASTVRAWAKAGRFPGSYKLNKKDYRIPLAGLLTFESAQRVTPIGVSDNHGCQKPSLSAWRSARKAAPVRRRSRKGSR